MAAISGPLDYGNFIEKTFLWETTQQIEYFALYECYLDGSTPDLLFWCRLEIQDDLHWRMKFNIPVGPLPELYFGADR